MSGRSCSPGMGSLYRAIKTLKTTRFLSNLITNPLNSHFRLTFPFCSHSRQSSKETGIDLNQYLLDRIRNFSIIAHVDHGKSTLADRLLELTGTIKRGHGQPQYLDKLQVERERGITVKAQTATMFYSHQIHGLGNNDVSEPPKFLLNLIDTPGHVDFSYEVSRSLAACQGVLLVVDAAQGVQAQTVANFYLAFESNLTIIPVINKIDQPTADPDRVKAQLKSMFDLDPSDALLTSAKTGQGLEQVLPAVIERIPPPPGDSSSPLRMLLLDSYYDEYRGVICHVAVVDGVLRKGDKFSSVATGQTYEVGDIGIMHPELTPTGILLTGQVGYIISGMRSTKEARVGDTLHHNRSIVQPLPGFKPAKHMVFSGLYPADGSDFEVLNHAIERLTCNDASVSVSKETSSALGMGFRCGFLGLLHMDVFHQRLEQEYGVHVISTVPTVPYIFEYSDGSKVEVQNPAALPSQSKQRVTACWEPTVIATIIMPSEHVGPVITLCSERRGQQLEYSFIDSQRAFMKYRLPLREIVVDFYNELKSITSGYASFDYEDSEYQQADLVKLDILLNGQPVDAMATIVHNLKAQRVGRELVEKLKNFIDRQMFEITIQAAIGAKVIARETISAMRKNVLAKCYGGDITRKRKLLEKQKEGKKRMKRVGSVDIPQEAFNELLKVS
ncbi:GTP_EFTU domain-containing protein/EFG_C domain-containing protein/GTP_EFTU_D2 domain-containing protein/LepA_C domain-containing protein [Cephalotus follicularis]|uniref:Translation factor GUF1 homolog, mitochondrial n=1 Tax=Cephalotus follicularis TaxID=3775 RepID=A0A1Q3BQF0_CEPFO|nr:GTP_EFTU domain-containing protein/EFG_C domain-containing protein/GTP_EFTU_D2 domain-containing protein/LepA_C domain-containing protein [Cephalotus follicularis]